MSDVEVKFGGSTDGLDAAAQQAQADIAGVSAAAKKAGGGFDSLNSTNRQLGAGFKLTGYQAQILSYQMNDVFSGLLTGQKPFQILMQQGPQITQIFGGVRGTFVALKAALTPAVIAMGAAVLAAGALIGAGAALYASWRNAAASNQAITSAIQGVGRTAGLTAQEVRDAAEEGAEAADISESSAERQAVAYARTGVIGAESMTTLISIGKDYAAMMGVEAEEATTQLADAMRDPAEAAREMTRQFGLLDQKTIELIDDQIEQGNQSAAQKILLDKLSEAVRGQATEIDGITSAWDAAARAVSNYWKRMGEALYTTPDEQLERLDRAIGRIRRGEAAGDLGLMTARRDALRETIQRPRDDSIAAAENQRQQEKADEDSANSSKGRTRSPRADNSARRAAEEAHRILMASLDREQAAYDDNYNEWLAVQDRKIAAVRVHNGEESTEYIRALQTREEYERQNQAKLDRDAERETERVRKAAQDRINAAADAAVDLAQIDEQLAQTRLDQDRDLVEAMFANGEIGIERRLVLINELAQKEVDLRAQTAERVYQIEQQAIRDRLALGGLESDEIARLNIALEALEVQHQQRLRVIRDEGQATVITNTREASAQMRNAWEGNVSTISSSFTSMFTQWGAGISSLQQGWQNFGRSLLSTIETYASQMLTRWVMTQLGMTAATAAKESAEVGIVAAGTATKTGIVQAGALAEIGAKAASAAAGAYSAIAGIPYVGPFLAPIAAAAALAGVLALGSKIFSAKGGWGQVPYDGAVTELHKDEMVLPASIATPLRSSLTGFGVGSTGIASQLASRAAQSGTDTPFSNAVKEGDTHLHLNTLDTGSARKWLEGESSTIAKAVKKQSRRGAFVRSSE